MGWALGVFVGRPHSGPCAWTIITQYFDIPSCTSWSSIVQESVRTSVQALPVVFVWSLRFSLSLQNSLEGGPPPPRPRRRTRWKRLRRRQQCDSWAAPGKTGRQTLARWICRARARRRVWGLKNPHSGPLFSCNSTVHPRSNTCLSTAIYRRWYNHYNHAHAPAPHMWPSPGPGPDSECSKTVEVGCSC